jgi:LysR family transcriptional regulator, cys regulon transcriptional activator
MKLQQLRYFVEVVRHGFCISDAALALYASQPGVSHHIRQLEQQLKFALFVRRGKRILGLTNTGRDVLAIAERIISDSENLKRLANESQKEATGEFIIAATHTQAHYLLPPLVRAFIAKYPKVQLCIKPCSPTEAAEYVRRGEANLCVSTEVVGAVKELVMIPGRKWTRCVITPPKHPLLQCRPLQLADIARYPLVTYDFAFSKPSKIRAGFEKHGLVPTIALTSADTGILKTFVAARLGIGIIASIAFNEAEDKNLRMLDASHLFESSITAIGIHRDTYMTRYMYDFIERVLPGTGDGAVAALLAGANT